jgi:WD40 repeat protein
VRFLQANFSVVAEAPLQIYCCLAFAPSKSIVRRTFESVVPKCISSLPKVGENWDACLLTLVGHKNSAISVVFSHDSKKVASGSYDKTIRMWDAETGECEDIIPLDGYTPVSSFATDGRGIVTDRGVFALSGGSQSHVEPAMLQQSSEAPILACIDGTWITVAGEDLLWLPPECRNGKVAVSGSRVVVGCRSGRVLVLGISMAEVEQWTDAHDY